MAYYTSSQVTEYHKFTSVDNKFSIEYHKVELHDSG